MNFWQQLESQQISKAQTEQYLLSQLGEPTNPTQTNLYQEILKKITSYYFAEPENQNYSTYSLFGYLTEIQEKKYKEGKNKGQTYYVLKLGAGNKEKLQARQEDLPEAKWSQITKSAILGQNLVFKYKKYFANKQIIDFSPQAKTK